MSRFAFQLGSNDHVMVALPSRLRGDALVRTGKAKIRVSALACTVAVAFEQRALDSFIDEVRKCHESVRGEFALQSTDGSFLLEGVMAPQGHVRVAVRAGNTSHRQKDDPQWDVSARLACTLHELAAVVRAVQSAEDGA